MKLKITALIAIAMLFASVVVAAGSTPEERGKALFNNTKLGGGTSGKSCGSCHKDGKDLEGISAKKMWKGESLEDAVNVCITKSLKGKALDVNSDQMKDLVSYINTFMPKDEQAAKLKEEQAAKLKEEQAAKPKDEKAAKPKKPTVGC